MRHIYIADLGKKDLKWRDLVGSPYTSGSRSFPGSSLMQEKENRVVGWSQNEVWSLPELQFPPLKDEDPPGQWREEGGG